MGLGKLTSALGIAAAPLTVATTIGDSLYNSYSNRKAAKQGFEYEKSLMDYQNEWNLAQWNRENEYNSPKNIMARYQEAGLNPNLIYQNSYDSPAHLESASGHAPQVKPSDLEMTHALLSFYNLEAQNQLLQAQTSEVKARKELIDTQKNNWTHDHANWQREAIDFLKGLFGGSNSLSGSSTGDPVFDNENPRFGFSGMMRKNAWDLYNSGKISKSQLRGIIKIYND